jgi:ankyrin repeat protein
LANDATDALQVLLQSGADPDALDPDSHQTLLMRAAATGKIDIIHMLLRAGSRPELRDADGKTADVVAGEKGQERALSILRLAKKH